MFNCNSNTIQNTEKKTRKAGLLVLLSVLVINMRPVVLPIQHGCEILKTACEKCGNFIGNLQSNRIGNAIINQETKKIQKYKIILELILR